MQRGIRRQAIWFVTAVIVGGTPFEGLAQAAAGPSPLPPRLALTVRTIAGPAGLPAFTTARTVATRILGQAGIDATWITCGGASQSSERSDACDALPAANEVMLRIVATAPSATAPSPSTLGFSNIDVNGGGVLATIYTDRVMGLAADARTDAGDLMGRAIAHEIGHLLLGTDKHSSRGLMRAKWSGTELQRDFPLDWLFSNAEAFAMRRTLAIRGSVAD